MAWAKGMGREDCASVLAETLAEEKATDEKLSTLAEARLNQMAETQMAWAPRGGRCQSAVPAPVAQSSLIRFPGVGLAEQCEQSAAEDDDCQRRIASHAQHGAVTPLDWGDHEDPCHQYAE